MLDGLLGRGFSSKCKSCIKQIKTRIDAIRRRRNAMQKFLKKDIADLLTNGLDINAYGRAGGLLVELNLSSCYDLVEEFCGTIPRHLSVMQKQSECPEECREAVSSLMFAAARFADLPELRELRQMFTERYGNSLDIFKNQEFVEKLAANPPTVDSKLQLMRDIAKESSIKWDSKAFEQKLSNPSAPAQDRPKRHTSLQERHNVVNYPPSSKDDSALKRDTQDDSALKRDAQDIWPRGRREPTDDGFKPHGREESVLKRDKEDASSRGRNKELTHDGYRASNGKHETTLRKDNVEVLPRGKGEVSDDEIKPRKAREVTDMKKDNQEVSSRGRRGYIVGEHQPHNVVVEKTVVQRENHNVPSHGRKEYIQDPYQHRDETFLKRDNQEVSSRGRRDLNDEGGEAIHKRDNWEVLSRKRHEVTANGSKLHHGRKDSVRETDNLDYASHGRIEEADDGHRLHGGGKNAVHRRIHQADSSHGKQEFDALPYAVNTHNVRTGHAGFREKAFEEAESIKPHYNSMIPPPYVRANDGKHSTRHATSDSNKAAQDTTVYDRDPNDRSERIHKEPNQERHEFGPARVHGHGDENSHHHRHEDDLGGDRKPKPKSVRRIHLKPPPGHEYIANNNNEGDEVLKSNISDRGRGDARRGLQHALSDDKPPKDEEEKMMDQLLMHYSKKPSKFEEVRVRAALNPPPGRHDVLDRKQGRGRLNMDSTHPPARALSLPQEPVTPRDSRRVPARATSFEPDMNQAGHVHPKLPDCDDLEARFASLRAR